MFVVLVVYGCLSLYICIISTNFPFQKNPKRAIEKVLKREPRDPSISVYVFKYGAFSIDLSYIAIQH